KKKTPATAPAKAATDAEGKLNCRGRVLSPEGKPVPQARVVFVRKTTRVRGDRVDVLAAQGRTGPDGRFQLEVPAPLPEQGKRSRGGLLLAVATGYGPGWLQVDRPEQALDATVKLVKDDVALEGRVIDLDGKPIAGVHVRVLGLSVSEKEDLGP